MSRHGSHTRAERALHRAAFSTRHVQIAAADLESFVCQAELARIEPGGPVFITSLPRAGTTTVLEILNRAPAFASHQYRDMPFILAPLLWASLSARFRSAGRARERAHGDRIRISQRSPEAFDEVLWRAKWPRKHVGGRLPLLSADETGASEFATTLRMHMRRVIAARGRWRTTAPTRYLSKNNGNIARLPLLRRLAPDAHIVVPFRAPAAQVASLLRQHLRFREIHSRNRFARRYMADLGHLEFGALHRPIDFAGMAAAERALSPESPEYWMTYWVEAFEHILLNAGDLVFVSHERLCADPTRELEKLAERLEVSPGAWIPAGASRIRMKQSAESLKRRNPRGAKPVRRNEALLKRAAELHEQLLEHSVD